MGIIELLFIALSLAMDAFAASLCTGLRMKRIDYFQALLAAGMFGVAQGVMPLIGWGLGINFQNINNIDHWVAFGLLGLIGVRMIKESRNDENPVPVGFTLKELAMLAIATSIDALAVGVTFAFLRVNVLPASIMICAVTFMLCFVGVCVGCRFGKVLKSKAELAGGVTLIIIGVYTLFEHFA